MIRKAYTAPEIRLAGFVTEQVLAGSDPRFNVGSNLPGLGGFGGGWNPAYGN